uniref:acid phosphatase n=2 Tax=Cacopsylla melanoneura TaxID=428564 RepID=A0A8D8T9D9_9HEMI
MFWFKLLCPVLSLFHLAQGNLVFVSIIFRHGDRTPISHYPNDPYKNASYWPVGPGQLTNVGKLQHYGLGQWFRARYQKLLGDTYSKENVYVMSTDVDRTLMSAESNLAGLFPPSGDQVWDPKIQWQPIPVHTTPEKMDKVLAMKKPCPQYDIEKKKYMASPEAQQFLAKYHPLFEYVSQHAGQPVVTPSDLEFIHNTLFIEETNNLTLPDWTQPIYPEPMRTVAAFSFGIAARTPGMKRLKGGPLLDDIVRHMVAKSKQKMKKKKLWIYSAHDTTVSNLLNTLDVFDLHCPPYASSVIIELHEDQDKYYVNVLYKNSTTPHQLNIPGCNFDCPLDQFVSLIKPVTVSDTQWEKECHTHNLFDILPESVEENSFATVVLLTMAVLLSLLLVSLVFYLHKKWRHTPPAHYQRI